MIFVTGGTGLVGSHLLLELLKSDKQVRALKRKKSNTQEVKNIFKHYSDQPDELFNKIEWVEGDILDFLSLELFLKDVEIIYHCAAQISIGNRQRKKVIENNAGGTANLVNAALKCGVKRLCLVSSIAALGKYKDKSPITENAIWVPHVKNSAYAESKFLSEMEIWRGIAEGLEAVIVNPSIIIGPGNWNKGSCRFFPMVYKGLPFYTTGVMGYIDVRSVAEAILMLTENKNFDKAKNQKFILCAENLEFRDFFNMIADAMFKPRPGIKISRFLLHLIRPISALGFLLTGGDNYLTRDTIVSASSKKYYDGSKITRMFAFEYRPVIQAVQNTAAIFLKEYKSNQA